MEIFMGSIMTFGFNFAPNQWQLCNGQMLSIQQYSALFALIGTNYGGNGTSTFQLPNLQGRMPIGMGAGAGLSVRTLGEASGVEQVALLTSNMPSHTHTATFTPSGSSGYNVSTNTNGVVAPTTTNNVLCGTAVSGPTSAAIWSTASPAPTIPLGGATGSVSGTVVNAPTGQGLPTPIMNPFLALNFSIALFGLFPSRN